jgi:hypothetical protein
MMKLELFRNGWVNLSPCSFCMTPIVIHSVHESIQQLALRETICYRLHSGWLWFSWNGMLTTNLLLEAEFFGTFTRRSCLGTVAIWRTLYRSPGLSIRSNDRNLFIPSSEGSSSSCHSLIAAQESFKNICLIFALVQQSLISKRSFCSRFWEVTFTSGLLVVLFP